LHARPKPERKRKSHRRRLPQILVDVDRFAKERYRAKGTGSKVTREADVFADTQRAGAVNHHGGTSQRATAARRALAVAVRSV
jgi:hypothetical protein